jgi:hypothetical protein
VGAYLQLLLREGAMLAVLFALGSGFAAWARPDGAWGSRLALAPAFGLAAGVALTTTTAELMAMKVGAWAVTLPAGLISVAVAVFQLRRSLPRAADFRRLAALLALGLVVATAFNIPLAARGSLGPVAYRVYDSPGYGVQAYEYAKYSLPELRPFAKFDKQGDLTKRYASYIDSTNQQVGFDTVASSANRLFGWPAMSDQSAFMIALLVVGALGLFAAIRSFAPSAPLPFALIGGALFAGPFYFELFLDGSQGAVSGLALIAPTVIAARQVIGGGARWRDVLLFGVLLAGVQTAYPYFIAPLLGGAIVVLAALVVIAWRRGRLSWPVVGRAALVVAALLVLAIGLSPVASSRTATYFSDQLASGLSITHGVPVFDLTAAALPSWLLQTREWYYLPPVFSSGLRGLLAGGLAPVALLGVIAVGMWRFRWALLLLPAAIVAILFAVYYDQHYGCSYCVQRSLLPVAPLVGVAVGVGLVGLWTIPHWWTRALAVIAAVCVVVVVGQLTSVEVRRGIDGAEVVPPQLRELLPAIHNAPGPIFLEAIGQAPMAPFAEPATYHVVQEGTDHRVAIATETDDFLGLAYLGSARKVGSEYTPLYRWVLTRAGGIRTPRQVVARRGPFALERRVVPDDVVVISGISLDTIAHDPRGIAWVHSTAMGFWVSALTPKTAYVRVTFAGQAAGLGLVKPTETVVERRTPTAVTFCMPVVGRVGLRRLTVQTNRPEDPPTAGPRPEFSELPVPGKHLRLAALSALPRPCRAGR